MARVLGRVRLSRVTDATTSPERQMEIVTNWAETNDHEIVGWAEDLDLSRSVDPLTAPELSPWLSEPERVNAWDILACWKLDRVATGSIYLNKVMAWCFDNGKDLVSVTENFDLSTWVGRLIAGVIAGVAEGELEAIRERNSSSTQHLLKNGRYRGSTTAFGYKAEKTDGSWRYVQDEPMAKLAQEIAERIVEKGEDPHKICNDLNERGVPTPEDHGRQRAGREMKGARWRSGNLVKLMRSPTLLGQIVISPVIGTKGGKKVYGEPEVLRGDDGKPIIRAEPVLDQMTFNRLQEALDRKNGKRGSYQKSKALLLRVIHCGVCGLPMYHIKGRSKVYYRCPSASYGTSCGNKSVPVEEADQLVTEHLLNDYGHVERMRRIYDPGSDVAAELAEVDAELTDVAGLIGGGLFKSGPARERLEARAKALSARREQLAAQEYREAGYIYERTGETFAERWAKLDDQEKNALLRDNGVRLDYTPGDWHITFGEIERLREAVSR
jgi:site-specific DNA recombinase